MIGTDGMGGSWVVCNIKITDGAVEKAIIEKIESADYPSYPNLIYFNEITDVVS